MEKKSYGEQIRLVKLVNSLTDIGVSLLHNKKTVLEIYKKSFEKKITHDIKNDCLCSITGNHVFKIKEHKTEVHFYYFGLDIPFCENINAYLIIGPFLTSKINQQLTYKDFSLKEVSDIKKTKKMIKQTIPYLTQDKVNNILLMLTNLISNPLVFDYPFIPQTLNSTITVNYEINKQDIKSIEMRYKEQAKMKSAIISGNVDEAKILAEKLEDFYLLFKDRVNGNHLRAAKNTLIIGNTSERLYAEEAGIHPFYLDKISEKYAIQIEKCNNIYDLSTLGKEMTIEYCTLIKRFSLPCYNPVVKRIINHIHLNISKPFSLSELSRDLCLNKHYLCKIFKEEVDETIVSFVNKLKIEEAKKLLLTSELSLSDISFELGYNNYSYFSNLFKKKTGLTPKQFRNYNIN